MKDDYPLRGFPLSLGERLAAGTTVKENSLDVNVIHVEKVGT